MKSRKRWSILLVAVAAVLVVLSDLPGKTTNAARQQDFKDFVTRINNDMLSCNASVSDTMIALNAILSHRSTQLVTAKRIMNQDEPNCSIAVNADLYDLSTLSPTNTLEKMNLDPAVRAFYDWAFPNAAALVADSYVLVGDPTNKPAAVDFRQRVKIMESLAAKGNQGLAVAAESIGLKPITVTLSSVAGAPKQFTS